ncbi:MAG: AraC family transcriptional regulator [Actinomycetota bacterium]
MVNFLFIEGLELDFFNPRSVVVFICILQGAIFAALLLWRYFKYRKTADFSLAVLLLLLSSSLITPLIGFANVYDRNQWLTYFPFAIAYSGGVWVWFYVVNLTDSKRKFSRKDLLFFIPTAIYLIFRLTLFSQNLEFKDWFDKNYYVPIVNPLVAVTEFLWNIAFLYFAIVHYRKYRAWIDGNFSDTEKIKFDWLRNFLYIFTFVFILGAFFDFTNNFLFHLSYIQYFYFELVLALVTYYLAIAGYLRSETIELEFSEAKSEEIEERRTLLPEKELAKLKLKLQSLMQNDKLYLEPNLTLTDLSKKLGVNSTVLSYAINNGFEKNFNDFVNEFRIAEVKQKLQKGESENLTLLGIAFDCGFNSKATFNRAFKKFTGISPKEFQTLQN